MKKESDLLSERKRTSVAGGMERLEALKEPWEDGDAAGGKRRGV